MVLNYSFAFRYIFGKQMITKFQNWESKSLQKRKYQKSKCFLWVVKSECRFQSHWQRWSKIISENVNANFVNSIPK